MTSSRQCAPFARVVRVARTGSTNADVAAALRTPGSAAQWPHLSVLVTEHQAAGRGRAGRTWETPRGTSLTASVVLRPTVPTQAWHWLGLLGGLAVVRAIRGRTGLPTALKWPNDVLVLGAGSRPEPGWGLDRKVAGVLAEAVTSEDGSSAAVLGLGVNLHQSPEHLVVPWATSLRHAGVAQEARRAEPLLAAVGAELVELLERWEAAAGEVLDSGLAASVVAECVTVGRAVQVLLPGGEEVVGRATEIGRDGALQVAQADGTVFRVMAGDVRHVRALSG